MIKKKWHDWSNIINRSGPTNAPNMVNRSAANHSPDKKPANTHMKGWKEEASKERFKKSHPGITHKHLHHGFKKEPTV